ncbi:MAG: hypothetical protein JNL74_24175 [Fibrobacteres bacterium]|nr:hypothetical protein [Fibrobacterota bacterium]
MKWFFSAFVIITFFSCSSTVKLNQPKDSAISAFESILKKRTPIRVAVTVFTSANSSAQQEDRFGSYITDEITSSLAGKNDGIRLFERKRLNTVIEEHSLSLTGIMSGEAAQQLGNLVPIDYIVTGSYTVMNNSVKINGRIINVVSGEIEGTINYDLAISEELKPLFNNNISANTNNLSYPKYISVEESCKIVTDNIHKLMTDLTTNGKKEALINAAVLIPFDTICGYVHLEVMSLLKKNSFKIPKYRSFLINTLDKIELPDSDRRALDIISFLCKTGPINDDEWNASLKVICRSSTYHHSYINYLIYEPFLETHDLSTAASRLDELMKLSISGKVGLPVPISPDKMFSSEIAGCGIYLSDTVPDLLVHIFDKYRKSISQKEFNSHRDKLEKLILRKGFEKERVKILEWINESYLSTEPSENSAADMLYFLRMLNEMKGDTGRTVKLFTEKYSPAIKKILPAIKVRSQRIDAINMCISLKLDVPGLVPTVEELATQMFSDTSSVQMDAADQLNRYGAKAAPVEKKVLKLLRRSERFNYSGSTNLRWSLIGILGNIKSGDKETIDELIKYLSSTDYAVPDSAMQALAKTGKKAIPALQAIFNSSETSQKIRIIKIFSLMSLEAVSVRQFIEQLAKTSDNAYLRDEAEDALERIPLK